MHTFVYNKRFQTNKFKKNFAATEFLRYFAAKTDITLFDDAYTFSV